MEHLVKDFILAGQLVDLCGGAFAAEMHCMMTLKPKGIVDSKVDRLSFDAWPAMVLEVFERQTLKKEPDI